MKKVSFLFLAVFILAVSCHDKGKQDTDWVKKGVETASFQLKAMASDIKDSGLLPRSAKDGEVRLEDAYDWTSGFFPGSLWYAYEMTKDSQLKKYAVHFTSLLDSIQYYTGTHDLGFMIFCSYGNGLRITGNQDYEKVIVNGSKSLISRFNPKVGLIRSWDFGDWSYPVIIDNMMNLEMLFYASKVTGDDSYKNVAIKHADVTLREHFRDDYSSYHVVSYCPETGHVESKGTFQGASDSSVWARGQAWGLYGYTLCYRETKDVKYLEHAKHIAELIMTHPNLPEDKIPFWDFNAPDIPDAPRDVSAAAVTACALLEMSTMVEDGTKYFSFAEDVLKTLSGSKYLAEKGSNNNFILKHAVGHLPANSEIDVPLNYADYYYLEGLKRYAGFRGITTK